MNKADIIKEVAEVTGNSKAAKSAVDCIFNSITDALKRNEAVILPGFGTFRTSRRKARDGRNPLTGEIIRIEERFMPKFTASKTLKDAVDGI